METTVTDWLGVNDVQKLRCALQEKPPEQYRKCRSVESWSGHMKLNTTPTLPSIRPFCSMALGAILGGVLLMVGFISVSGENPWEALDWSDWGSNDFESYRRSELRESLLLAACIGGLCGTTVGGALWVTFARRRVSSILLVASCWLLGAIAGLILAVGALALPLMAPHMNVGRDGSGGPGVGLLILVVGLTGVVTGSVAGTGIGIWRVKVKNRGR